MTDSTLYLEADVTSMQDRLAGLRRRQAERFHFALGTVGFLDFPEDGSSQEVWLVDISELGIGFCSDWPLDPGTELVLKLTANSKGSLTLAAKVVHATRQPRGDWRIGCRFQPRLTADVLDALL